MTADFSNVTIDTFDGLTVEYAVRKGASVLLRIAPSGHEYELQMALMNRKLQPGLETVFMMPEKYSYLSRGWYAKSRSRAIGRVPGPRPCGRSLEKMDPAYKLRQREKPKGKKGKR
jgi:hypothetical protein